MNPLEVYSDAGRKAGKAARNQDWPCVSHWERWMRQALSLESKQWATMARNAYKESYKTEVLRV